MTERLLESHVFHSLPIANTVKKLATEGVFQESCCCLAFVMRISSQEGKL